MFLSLNVIGLIVALIVLYDKRSAEALAVSSAKIPVNDDQKPSDLESQ